MADARVEEMHPKLPNGSEDTLFQVRCTNPRCGTSGMPWYPKKAAIHAWNDRASVLPSLSQRCVDALCYVIGYRRSDEEYYFHEKDRWRVKKAIEKALTE
jgi:hypothetical protein